MDQDSNWNFLSNCDLYELKERLNALDLLTFELMVNGLSQQNEQTLVNGPSSVCKYSKGH